MALKCPHCSEDVPDAVPVDTMKQRLTAKQTQIDDLKAELGEQRQRADGLASKASEYQAAAEKLAALEARQAQDAAIAEAGLRSDLSDRARRILASEYDAATEGVTEKPSFAEWLKSELSAETPDPIFAGLRAETPSDAPALPAGRSTVTRPPPPPVDRSTGAPPPPATSSRTTDVAARVEAHLASLKPGEDFYATLPEDLRSFV